MGAPTGVDVTRAASPPAARSLPAPPWRKRGGSAVIRVHAFAGRGVATGERRGATVPRAPSKNFEFDESIPSQLRKEREELRATIDELNARLTENNADDA